MRLWRALDGDGDKPWPLTLGRLCEEFHCLPSAALREWWLAPAGLLEEIVEARAFAREKAHYESLPDKSKAPDTPLMRLVKEINAAVHLEDLEQFQRELNEEAKADGTAL